MSKFKVGDSVRLKEGLSYKVMYGKITLLPRMFFDRPRIIIQINDDNTCRLNVSSYDYDLSMFELAITHLSLSEIIDRNYKATVKRGKITTETTVFDFIRKIHEEHNELADSYFPKALEGKSSTFFDEKELADVALVCFAMAKHFNIDLLKVMEEKTLYNETRKD